MPPCTRGRGAAHLTSQTWYFGAGFFKIADGKMVASWLQTDLLALMQPLTVRAARGVPVRW